MTIDVYNIIRQLTDQEDPISGQMKRECFNELLPIKDYYKGWNFRQGEEQFNFLPHEDYPKDRYELKINNINDDVERAEKIEALNEDIDEYNDWVNEKNQLHSDELLEKAIPDGKMHDVKDLNLESKRYFILGKHKPWLCSFIIEHPQFRKMDNSVEWGWLDDEDIYKVMQQMEIEDFVKRFNATLFDYVRQSVGWLEKNHAWGESSLWYEPNREFATWFATKNLRPIIPDVDPAPDGFEAVEPFKTGFMETGGLPTSTSLAHGILPQIEPQTTETITNAEMNEEMKEIFEIREIVGYTQEMVEKEIREIFNKHKDKGYFIGDNGREQLQICYEWGCKFWTLNGSRLSVKQMQKGANRYPK
tara:strand:- start:1025 stop:2107 length:1083 start_codon:yes stop_codon:yes gene_type:complete